MKKRIVMGAIACVLCIVAVGAYAPVVDYLEWQDKPTDSNVVGIYAWEIKEIDEVMPWTDTVAMVRLDAIKVREYNHTYFVGTVTDSLMGAEVGEEIIIYTDMKASRMDIGQEYLFFLNKMNSFAYPENSYGVSWHNTMYRVFLGKLNGYSQVADSYLNSENNTVAKMKTYLAKAVKALGEEDAKEKLLPDSFETVDLMYTAAARVAKIKVTDCYRENQRVDLVKLEVVETYKGEVLREDLGYFLPAPYMEIGEEYYVFFSENIPTELMPVARNGAIIGMDKDNWEEVKTYLESK